MRRSLEYLGARLIRFFEATGEILILFARTVSSCRKAIQNRQNIMKQMAFMGVGTLPIALLMGFFIGMVLALQTGYQLLRFNLEGIIGGAIISATYVGVGIQSYFDNLFDSLTFDEVFRGLLKAMFFGGIVATIGCYKGFKTTGGAEGVGVYTTQSVVLSFILIVVFDYFLSRLLL